MSTLFKPIQNVRVAEELTSQIIQSIIKRKLNKGDKLPSERELAEMCSVSRVTVREALRTLEKKGLVVIKRGAKGGAFITEINFETVEDSLNDFFNFGDVSLEKISEARLIIEPAIAELASKKRTSKNLEEIEEVINHCRQLIDTGQYEVDAQVQFHYAIARASKNPVLMVVSNSLMNFLSRKLYLINPNIHSFMKDQEFHFEIFDAIKNNNEKKAFQVMKEHVEIFKKLHQEELDNK